MIYALALGLPLAVEGAGDRFGAALLGGEDLDGDGVVDLVVGAPGADRIVVYTEGLTASATLDGAGGDVFAWVPDVDGDGRVDLVAADTDTGAVYVYTAGLGAVTTLQVDGAASLAGGDVDGDGVGDVIVGAPGADVVVVYLGPDFAGGWTLSGAAGDRFGAAVAALDVDGDGIDEVAVGAPDHANEGCSGGVYLYAGASGPTWAGSPLDGEGELGVGLVAADLDGDGFEDLVVATRAPEAGFARAWLSTGATLAETAAWSSGGAHYPDDVGPWLGDLGDIDGDGRDDVAYDVIDAEGYIDGCRCEAERVGGVVRGGPGGLTRVDDLLLPGAGPIAVAGDVDGNGTMDLALGVPDAGVVSLRLTWPDADRDDPYAFAAVLAPDCDDANDDVHFGGDETDGDGVDGDCDGEDDRPAATHALTCPSFTTFEEAHAFVDESCPPELCVPDLLDEVWSSVVGGSGGLESGCTDATWSGTSSALRATYQADDCTGGVEVEGTWLDVAPGAETLGARAWMSRSEDEVEARGVLRWPDGTAAWFDLTSGAGRTSTNWGDSEYRSAHITFGECSYASSYSYADGQGQSWAISDGTHTAVVDSSYCAHGWLLGSFDGGPEVPIDPDTWAPVAAANEDADGDGWPASADCDEADPDVHPCAFEDGLDDVDDNCDGSLNHDADGDRVPDETDCAPDDASAAWTWDLYVDADGDGWGVGSLVTVCGDTTGYADTAGDCDDTDPAAWPGAFERSDDGVDQDCDGRDRVTPADAPGCGCAGSPAPFGPLWGAVVIAALTRRRARPRRSGEVDPRGARLDSIQ